MSSSRRIASSSRIDSMSAMRSPKTVPWPQPVVAVRFSVFCSTCTRARLSTDGQLFTCLFAEQGYDLKQLVRGAALDADIARAIGAIWQRRDDRYSEIRTAETASARKVEMSFIGG